MNVLKVTKRLFYAVHYWIPMMIAIDFVTLIKFLRVVSHYSSQLKSDCSIIKGLAAVLFSKQDESIVALSPLTNGLSFGCLLIL